MSIDRFHRLLHLLGWSVGEAAFDRVDGSRYWQVDGTRDGHTLLAVGPTQYWAWFEAVRLAGVIKRDG